MVGPAIYSMNYTTILQENGEEKHMCERIYPETFHRFLYIICMSIMFMLIPMVVIATSQIIMLNKINKLPSMECTAEELKRSRKIKKISKTFQIIFVVFFILTLPHAIFIVVVEYFLKFNPAFIGENLYEVMKWNNGTLTLLMCNSCANVFVYGKAHSKLRMLLPIKCRALIAGRTVEAQTRIEMTSLRRNFTQMSHFR